MNVALRSAYEAELSAADTATVAGKAEVAFHHLERAHILSQRHTSEHVRVHWLMLRLARRLRMHALALAFVHGFFWSGMLYKDTVLACAVTWAAAGVSDFSVNPSVRSHGFWLAPHREQR